MSVFLLQAIAREDKGILGKDWNKSDKTYFRTTSFNPTVPPEQIKREQPSSSVVIPEVRHEDDDDDEYDGDDDDDDDDDDIFR